MRRHSQARVEQPRWEGSPPSHLTCFFDPGSVRRAIRVALIVGPVLGLINHFELLAGGEFTVVRLFKIGLTFLVPFCVSTYSSATTMMARNTQHYDQVNGGERHGNERPIAEDRRVLPFDRG